MKPEATAVPCLEGLGGEADHNVLEKMNEGDVVEVGAQDGDDLMAGKGTLPERRSTEDVSTTMSVGSDIDQPALVQPDDAVAEEEAADDDMVVNNDTDFEAEMMAVNKNSNMEVAATHDVEEIGLNHHRTKLLEGGLRLPAQFGHYFGRVSDQQVNLCRPIEFLANPNQRSIAFGINRHFVLIFAFNT